MHLIHRIETRYDVKQPMNVIYVNGSYLRYLISEGKR